MQGLGSDWGYDLAPFDQTFQLLALCCREGAFGILVHQLLQTLIGLARQMEFRHRFQQIDGKLALMGEPSGAGKIGHTKVLYKVLSVFSKCGQTHQPRSNRSHTATDAPREWITLAAECSRRPMHLILTATAGCVFGWQLQKLEAEFLDESISAEELQTRATALTAFTRTPGLSSWQFRRSVLSKTLVDGHRARIG